MKLTPVNMKVKFLKTEATTSTVKETGKQLLLIYMKEKNGKLHRTYKTALTKIKILN